MEEAKFNRLSISARANLVWKTGKYVESVTFNNYCMMLYSINRHFIEVFIDLKSNTIIWISLANEYDLNKYLPDVHIEV